MTVRLAILFSSLILLLSSGCGGGSSSSPERSPVPTPPPEPDTTAPNLTIDRYTPVSQTAYVDKNAFVLSGTASDNVEISYIHVNDIEFETSSFLRSNNNGVISLNWSISIPLSLNDNTLVITAEDSSGNISSEEQIEVNRQAAATYNLIHDPSNNAWVQYSLFDAYAISEETLEVSEANLGDSRLGRNNFTNYQFNSNGDHLYKFTFVDHVLSVATSSMSTLETEVIAEVTLPFDRENWQHQYLRNVIYNEQDGGVYLALVYVPVAEDMRWQSRVLFYDLETDSLSVIANENFDNRSMRGMRDLAVTNQHMLALISNNSGQDSLLSIDRQSGEVTTQINDLAPGFFRLVIDDNRQSAYISSHSSIAKIDLTTWQFEMLSENSDQDLYPLTYPTHPLIDDENERLILRDSGLNEILAIDLNTGERSILVPQGVGEGAPFFTSGYMAVNNEQKTAYVSTGNHPGDRGSLIAVNLENGNREAIFRTEWLNNNFEWASLALDQANDTLYAADGDRVLQLNLTTQSASVIAASDIGNGATLSDVRQMTIHPDNDQVIVYDRELGQLIEINTNTFERSVLFDNLPGTVSDLTFSADDRLFVYIDYQGIFELDTANNQMSVIVDDCQYWGRNQITGNSEGNFLQYNEEKNTLLFGAFLTMEYSLDTSQCQVYEQRGFREAAYLDNDSVLVLDEKAIYEIDLNLDQSYLISN